MLFVATNLKVAWQKIRDRINFDAVLHKQSGNSSNAFLLEWHIFYQQKQKTAFPEQFMPISMKMCQDLSQENVSSIMEFLLPFLSWTQKFEAWSGE